MAKIERVPAGTCLRWHLTANALERAWAIGDTDGGHMMRCVVPPTPEGKYRNLPSDSIVTDSDVLTGMHHHSPRLRAAFAALPAGVLAAAQEQARTDDPYTAEIVAKRLARAAQ